MLNRTVLPLGAAHRATQPIWAEQNRTQAEAEKRLTRINKNSHAG